MNHLTKMLIRAKADEVGNSYTTDKVYYFLNTIKNCKDYRYGFRGYFINSYISNIDRINYSVINFKSH